MTKPLQSEQQKNNEEPNNSENQNLLSTGQDYNKGYYSVDRV